MRDLDVVTGLYGAVASGDLDAVLALLAEDCVVTQDPELPWGGDYVGPEGFTRFALLCGTLMEFRTDVVAMFESDGEVIVYGRMIGIIRANGVEFDVPQVQRWTVRDGRVATGVLRLDTVAMLAALEGAGDRQAHNASTSL